MSENSKALRNAWKLKIIKLNSGEPEKKSLNYYVSAKDYDSLKNEEKLALSYYYQTHVLPQPYFWNIDDPKIVVLAKNPTYDIKYEKKETDKLLEIYKEYKEDEANIIYDNGYNLLFEQYDKKTEKVLCTKKWWSSTFGDLATTYGLENIKKKTGIFNLCGYHSKSYFDVPKGILESGNVLPTQKCLREYLRKLIKTDVLVIIIWGEKDWSNFLKDEYFDDQLKQGKIFVVNKGNSANRYITSSKQYDNFKNKIIESLEK